MYTVYVYMCMYTSVYVYTGRCHAIERVIVWLVI